MPRRLADAARRAVLESLDDGGQSLDVEWARMGASEAVLATVAGMVGAVGTWAPSAHRAAPFAAAMAKARPQLEALIADGDRGVRAALTLAGHVWNDTAPTKERRRHGAHFTPVDVADRVVEICLDRADPPSRITDPACGAGVFLLAAADALVSRGVPTLTALRSLHGTDLDPLAIDLARSTLAVWARWRGVDRDVTSLVETGVVCGDGLHGPSARWDLIVGNPPFQSQLLRRTSRDLHGRELARQVIGNPVRYADSAALFLAHAAVALEPGGVAALIVPESVLGAADAEPVRQAIAEHADLIGMWFVGGGVFGAAVRVCVPVLRRRSAVEGSSSRPTDGDGPIEVSIWRGRTAEVADPVPSPRTGRWASIAADASGVPRLDVHAVGTLADLVTVAADFRDVFYALAAAAVDLDDVDGLDDLDDRDLLKVVTVGSIDPLTCWWGERPTRLLRRSFGRPVIRRQDVALPPGWFDARLQPKILVASQTRVIEAVPDVDATMVPVTPVLSVVPDRSADLWRVLAALSSPVTSALVARRGAGTGLSSDAVRVRGADLLATPLPVDHAAWDEAARVLSASADEPDSRVRRAMLLSAARITAGAYGLEPEAVDAVRQWWEARLPAP